MKNSGVGTYSSIWAAFYHEKTPCLQRREDWKELVCSCLCALGLSHRLYFSVWTDIQLLQLQHNGALTSLVIGSDDKQENKYQINSN